MVTQVAGEGPVRNLEQSPERTELVDAEQEISRNTMKSCPGVHVGREEAAELRL